MKLALTDASTNQPMAVESDLIRLIEPSAAPVGTHIVFDGSQGRVVLESYQSIVDAVGAVAPAVVAAALVKAGKKK